MRKNHWFWVIITLAALVFGQSFPDIVLTVVKAMGIVGLGLIALFCFTIAFCGLGNAWSKLHSRRS